MRKTAVLALVVALAGCFSQLSAQPSAEAGQRTIKDDLGFEFPLGDPPRRIISLAPNITEVLFALGLGDRLEGVTRYCDYPPQAVRKAKMGGLTDPDLEKIQACAPDLVIAFRGNPLEVVRKMRDLKLPVFVLDTGNTLDDLFTMISRIGRVTQRDLEAGALVRRLEEQRDRVRDKLKKASHRVKAFLLLPGEGLWTCGSQSYFHDLLEQSAAVNVAAGIPRPWANYSREELFSDDPDVLVILARNAREFKKEAGRLGKDPRLKGLAAVRLGRLVHLDENKASRFGPRLLEALAELARAIHPECFR